MTEIEEIKDQLKKEYRYFMDMRNLLVQVNSDKDDYKKLYDICNMSLKSIDQLLALYDLETRANRKKK